MQIFLVQKHKIKQKMYQLCTNKRKNHNILWFLMYLTTIYCGWWGVQGSNLWPPACKADALPTELTPHMVTPTGIEPVLPPWKGDVLTAWPRSRILVAAVGFEPTTCRVWTGRYNHLSYAATSLSRQFAGKNASTLSKA